MGDLRNISTRFQTAVDLYDETLQQTIAETAPGFVPETIQVQLTSGIKSTGLKITPQYATTYYSGKKFKLNPLAGLGTPDLKVSGTFYEGIAVVVNAKSFVTSSNVDYADKLELQYGSEIYGLTAENKSYYSTEIVKPALFAKIREQTTG